MLCEDEAGNLPSKATGLGGLYISNLFRDPRNELRIEYAKTQPYNYVHHIYTSGYTYKGRIIGHHIGPNGYDLFLKLTRWINPKFSFDLVFNKEVKKPSKLRGSCHEEIESFGIFTNFYTERFILRLVFGVNRTIFSKDLSSKKFVKIRLYADF
jgi:hypothetical protein